MCIRDRTISVVDPKEKINQNPVDVSKLKNDNTPIINEAAIPAINGLKLLGIFIYIFFKIKLYTHNEL